VNLIENSFWESCRSQILTPYLLWCYT